MGQGNKIKKQNKGEMEASPKRKWWRGNLHYLRKTYGNLLSYKARKLELPSACHKSTSPEVKG